MGAFFTNVQVRASGDEALDAAVLCLGELARASGMSPVGEEAEADRTIVLASGADGWLSVYDEATEQQDTAALDLLASALSQFTNSYAVTVLVHDSDVLFLALFARGEPIDQVNSHPGYFSSRQPTAAERKSAAGHAERWAPVLADGATTDSLAKVWSEEKLFAEQTLARTAELLGCPAARMSVGYRYLQRDASSPHATRTLRFRLDERPACEGDETGPVKLGTDLPAEFASMPARHQLAVGDELRLAATCRNSGGPGRGLRIEVRGNALDRALVQIDSFQLLIGNVMKGAQHVELAPRRSDGDGEVVVSIEAQEVLPAGVAGGLASLAGGRDWRAAQDAMARSQVHVNVVGKVLAPGAGELTISLLPRGEGPDAGFRAAQSLVIDPPLYRPRRARQLGSPLGGGSHVVRPLGERDVLVAFLVYGSGQAEAAVHAARAIERFAAACPPVARYDTGIFHADASRRPKTGSVAAKSCFRGKRWGELQKAFASERQVTITPGIDPAELATVMGGRFKRKGHGFGFGVPILPSPSPRDDDPELPALGLWARIDQPGETHAPGLRALIVELFEDAMVHLAAPQGFITSWGQEPSLSDTTLYEQACGIHGPLLARRSWSTRWLRAIPNETLWIGPELRGQLPPGARDELTRIATVDDLGEAWRVTLKDSGTSSVERLEEIVDALLPTEAGFREAQMAAYRAPS